MLAVIGQESEGKATGEEVDGDNPSNVEDENHNEGDNESLSDEDKDQEEEYEDDSDKTDINRS